jgi:hypothetical protein
MLMRALQCHPRHCERSEAIHCHRIFRTMDCFRGACHRARIGATRWLAMTIVQLVTTRDSNAAGAIPYPVKIDFSALRSPTIKSKNAATRGTRGVLDPFGTIRNKSPLVNPLLQVSGDCG